MPVPGKLNAWLLGLIPAILVIVVLFRVQSNRFNQLSQRLDTLERASRRPAVMPGSASAPERERVVSPVSRPDTREDRPEKPRSDGPPFTAQGVPKAEAPAFRGPADLSELRMSCADSNRSAEERVGALEKLRDAEIGGQSGARDRSTVAHMLQLLDTLVDPSLKADILRNIKGAVPADLKAPVLQRLRADTEAKVREEAAETLGPLRTDPEVRIALEYAVAHDPSGKVKDAALNAMEGKRSR